jgi:hypothetical protein
MSLALLRSGEDVSAFSIGKFGDVRLEKTGALFFKRLWCRDEKFLKQVKKSRPIEEKESIRWINTALSAKVNITNAAMITVIGDR